MMNQIQMWQLLVDIGLITSVLTMTIRAFKSSRLTSILPKTRELEASLRNLIGDAETAGLQLNDQLLRREQNIQKALAEIQASETRISKAIAEAEALQNKLQITRTETVRVIQDLKNGFEQGVNVERSRLEERTQAAQVPTAQVSTQAPLASRETLQEVRERPVQPHSEEFVAQAYSAAAAQRSNDLGALAQLSAQNLRAYAPSEGLTTQESLTPKNPAELQRVYKSAEQMIKGGAAVENVATQMKLPVEGVKLLAQMIEIEREEDSRKQDLGGKLATTDSRLGALAAMRRQSSIL